MNGGSFAITVGHRVRAYPATTAAVPASARRRGARWTFTRCAPYEHFRPAVFKHRDDLLAPARRPQAQGKTVLGYGASTKGNVILQYCGITPRSFSRHRRGQPGQVRLLHARHRHSHRLRGRRPRDEARLLLVLPWHFRRRILEREKPFLDRGGKMIFPLPEIEIIDRGRAP